MEEQRWLRQAGKDLESARDSLRAKHYEWACFQSQQAAEKALKAFLYSKGLRPILTHSIKAISAGALGGKIVGGGFHPSKRPTGDKKAKP